MLSVTMATLLAGSFVVLAFSSDAEARRRHYGGGAVAAGVVGGLILGAAIADSNRRYYPRRRYYQPRRVYRSYGGNAHINWCYRKYRSYRAYDNTFQPYRGGRRYCRSPYN